METLSRSTQHHVSSKSQCIPSNDPTLRRTGRWRSLQMLAVQSQGEQRILSHTTRGSDSTVWGTCHRSRKLWSHDEHATLEGYACAGSLRPAILLIVFIVLPELVTAQFLLRIANMMIRIASGKLAQYRYWIAAGLGSHVVVSGTPVLLSDIDPARLRYERNRYGLVRLARFVVLLLLLVQYIGNIRIYIRTTMVYNDRFQLYMVFDRQSYQLALGGAAATMNSTLLSLSNMTWSCESSSAGEAQVVGRSESASNIAGDQALTLSIEDEGILDSSETLVGATRSEVKHAIPEKIRLFDRAFRVWLDRLSPIYLHYALEAGMTFRILADNAMSLLISWLGTEFQLPESSIAPSAAEAANSMRTPPSTLLLRSKRVMDRTFPILMALVAMLYLLSHSKSIGIYAPRAGTALDVCNKYMAEGRSILTFPLYLMLLVYWIVAYVAWYISYAHIYKGVIHVLREGDKWEQLRWRMYMYKDLWYDSMYILIYRL